MVEVSSNIWGTKFKIHGIDLNLPPLLGQVWEGTKNGSSEQTPPPPPTPTHQN